MIADGGRIHGRGAVLVDVRLLREGCSWHEEACEAQRPLNCTL